MAVTESYTGTEAVGSTEHSCTTDTAGPDADTTDGVFQLVADVSDMIAGDVLEIRWYEKARSGDTQRGLLLATLVGAQADPLWTSFPLIGMHGWDFTLKATSGTITVNWSIRKAG